MPHTVTIIAACMMIVTVCGMKLRVAMRNFDILRELTKYSLGSQLILRHFRRKIY